MISDHRQVLESLKYDGIRINKLELASFLETGRGLAATKTLKKHEILMTIPTRHLINLKVIGKEWSFDWTHSPLPAHVALALYILHHSKVSDSPLKSYIESLPRSFVDIPLTWDSQMTDLLPESAQTYLSKQRRVYKKHYDLAQKYLSDHPSLQVTLLSTLDLSEFCWAWLVVNSRCIYQALSPTSTRDDNYACSPLIDMINHVPSSVPHCKLSYDIKGLSVLTQSGYNLGEEVFISYGAHSNEALLCEYGFTIPGNTDNSLTLDAPISRILKPWHLSMLMEVGFYEDCTLDYRGIPSFRTEVVMRAALLSEADCDEESTGCRRLTQFINGHSSGQAEQADVDMLLSKILENEMQDARVALTRLEEGETMDSRTRSIRQLWLDRQECMQAAMTRLR